MGILTSNAEWREQRLKPLTEERCQALAQALLPCFRSSDELGRWAGPTFQSFLSSTRHDDFVALVREKSSRVQGGADRQRVVDAFTGANTEDQDYIVMLILNALGSPYAWALYYSVEHLEKAPDSSRRPLPEPCWTIDGLDANRRSLLLMVVADCQLDFQMFLLEQGAPVEADNSGHTSLHCLALGLRREDTAPLFQACLARGMPVSAQDRGGRTPLHIAAECGNRRAVQWLLAADADVAIRDDQGKTPLDWALKRSDPDYLPSLEIVTILTEAVRSKELREQLDDILPAVLPAPQRSL